MVSRIIFIGVILLVLLNQVSVEAAPIKCNNPVNCLIDPCKVTTCKKYPNAKCRVNYCGGCNAKFYVGRKKVDCGT